MVKSLRSTSFLDRILYDDEILEQVWLIVKNWKFNEVKNFYKDVRKNGLKANAPNLESLLSFTKKILDLSIIGLIKRHYKK